MTGADNSPLHRLGQRLAVHELTSAERKEVQQYKQHILCRYGFWLDDEQTDFNYGQSTQDVELLSGRWVRLYVPPLTTRDR